MHIRKCFQINSHKVFKQKIVLWLEIIFTKTRPTIMLTDSQSRMKLAKLTS